MNVPRRILPDAANRRGWCPSLARPMPTGDGLLARIHPPLGILTRAQIHAVAAASRAFGNGHVDVTARANLQLRGVTEATRPALVAALGGAGLGDMRADGGPQRLTLTSPLAGLTAEAVDVRAMASAIEAHGLAIAGLPPKTLVLIEGGGTDLSGIAADIHVRATGPGIAAVGLADEAGVTWIATCDEARTAEAVAGLLRAFATSGRRRIRDLADTERGSLVRALPAILADAPPPPSVGDCGPPSPAGGGGKPALSDRAFSCLEIAAPFGRCTAAMLDRLAEVADGLGIDEVRVSPTRGFVLPMRGVPSHRRGEALADLAAAGFVTAPDDPRRAVATCPGAPACASGSTQTGADAARLAEAFRPFAASGMTAHVSGCTKGCAHPARADLTLVARNGRYGVVLDGSPGDAPALELTFDAALERVWRAKSGTLAQAFGPSPSPRQAFAEPAIGTTI
ncbi:precorrin-3B synthase [Methylobacterium sp. E-041]|uniref:precorrin-3B synthase n=1 Tax=Methylobacterium sp. E-041 TaxID=2836573 RepID=UPI001FB87212|nr:precorrin-3B synthase [Methylobacterium sp. E-041]MCJ2107059.1 precorrin-3B synthase [Methylobacterium sp. E-041]